MNIHLRHYRSLHKGKKWTCPSIKRIYHEHSVFERRELTAVIYPHSTFSVRNGFFMNHHIFEWLHKRVKGVWYASITDSFSLPGKRLVVAVFFEREEDAMLLHLGYEGGMLVSGYGGTIEREQNLRKMRWHIGSLSAVERQIAYPGLDSFLLANYTVPDI